MDHLVRLALAAILRAVHFEGARIADTPEAPPECRRYPTVVWILYHADSLSFLDQLAPLAAELEFISRVVDRPGDVGAHEYPPVDRAEHCVERARAGLDVEIRHAIDRRPVPGAGACIPSPPQTPPPLTAAPPQLPCPPATSHYK